MFHNTEQEYIMENPTVSIDTAATSDTEKVPENSLKSDGWKEVNQKYKTRRGDPIKLAVPKITGICTRLYGFICMSWV